MIFVNQCIVNYFSFPGKEIHLTRDWKIYNTYSNQLVEISFEGSDDIMALLLVDNLLKLQNYKYDLLIKYFPYARQDRHTTKDSPFSLRVMTDIIKLCNVNKVIVWDPHSDILEALLPEGMLEVVSQSSLLVDTLKDGYQYLKKNFAIVSPDSGALKKIYSCAKAFSFDVPVVKADKNRNTATGEITGSMVYNLQDVGDKDLLIVDDICDGGRTFIELAKAIKDHCDYKQNKIHLYITHGIFSKGLDVFDQYIDKIFCANIINKEVNLKEYNKRR